MIDSSAAPLGCARGSRASPATGSLLRLALELEVLVGGVVPLELEVLVDDVVALGPEVLVEDVVALDVDVPVEDAVELGPDVPVDDVVALELEVPVEEVVGLVALVVAGGGAGTQRVLSGGAIGYWTAPATCVATNATPSTATAPATDRKAAPPFCDERRPW